MGNKITGEDLSQMLCPRCAGVDRVYTLKLIDPKQVDVKYIPQIKVSCKPCGRYLKFALQTPELIARFNRVLEGITLDD